MNKIELKKLNKEIVVFEKNRKYCKNKYNLEIEKGNYKYITNYKRNCLLNNNKIIVQIDIWNKKDNILFLSEMVSIFKKNIFHLATIQKLATQIINFETKVINKEMVNNSFFKF